MSAIVAVAFCLPSSALAQVCDEDKVRKRTNLGTGYAERSPTLCEGTYGRNVSGNALSFVGITNRYRLAGYDPITLNWDGPDEEVHVRVESWDEQAFQMDARPSGAELSWDPMIPRREAIDVGRLGFLAWVAAEGGTRVYVPLQVAQGRPGSTDRYIVSVLPNTALERVSVTLGPVEAAGQTTSASPVRENDPLTQEYRVGQAFSFTIRHGELPEPGMYLLRLDVSLGGGGSAELTAWFHHRGDA